MEPINSFRFRGVRILFLVVFFFINPFFIHFSYSQSKANPVFAKQNIVAWCIVPFDVKNRGPIERAQMLNKLGITKLAYDWREKHISSFDDELDALSKHNIQLQAFWLMSGANASSDKNVEAVFDFLKRRNVKTQIWYFYNPPKEFDSLSQQQKVETAAKTVAYVARRADSIGCTVGLYNHEGWYGEPENQLAIIQYLKMKNIGIVYNFNHAQNQIDRFAQFYPKILPHLIALNLAGLKKGDQHIYPIGKGDSEKDMIRLVWNSPYKGPIGIINEDTHPDAAVGLQMNMDGLRIILQELGDTSSSKTYETEPSGPR